MLTEIQFEQAVAAFVTFFVLIDAPGVAPISVLTRCSREIASRFSRPPSAFGIHWPALRE